MPDDSWREFEVQVSDAFNQALLAGATRSSCEDVPGERELKMTLARAIGARSALVVPVRARGPAGRDAHVLHAGRTA